MKITMDEEITISVEERAEIENLGELLLIQLQPKILSKIKEKTKIQNILVSKEKVAFDIKCSLSPAVVYYRLSVLFGDDTLKDKYRKRQHKFTETGLILYIDRFY